MKKATYLCFLCLVLNAACSEDELDQHPDTNSQEEQNATDSDTGNTDGDGSNTSETTLNLKVGFKVVFVQPIIIANDSSTEAYHSFDEDKVNSTYSKAKVQFVFLKSSTIQNNAIYNGEMDLDPMKGWLASNNHLVGENDIVHLVLSKKLLGSDPVLGRGQLPGTLTFAALEENAQSLLNVFVVAHEVGHNFGLYHANEDENVPDEPPNVMGIGDYEDRLNPENAFNNYQIGVINTAAILHSKEKAEELIKKYELKLKE